MINIKDSFKFLGIIIVCFCAVFVCTFFLNYYLDILPLKNSVTQEVLPLYNAQLATAKMTCAITGGFLSLIAVIMLLFYIKIYIDKNNKAIGTFKAMGYSNFEISKSFIIFGICVFIGCFLGFTFGWIFMSYIYKNLTINGLPEVVPAFHFSLFIFLVIAPTLFFSFLSCFLSNLYLKKPTIQILKGLTKQQKNLKQSKKENRPFLKEMMLSTLKSKKILVFFITFSSFCFSAMVQMGLSMEDLASGAMGLMILIIGVVLAVVSMLMAMTTLILNNTKNLSILKALGYTKKECFNAIFVCYIPFLFLGFFVGTIYQYGLLSLMVNLIFKDVENMPTYNFNVKMFFVTLILFLIFYTLVFLYFLRKANKTPIKEIMLEN